jgi:hypothetical protein
MDKCYTELPGLFGTCCQFDFSAVLGNPGLLGTFLTLAKLVRELEPQARTAAVNFALAGVEIPGFTLVRHETPGYVETETLSELFSSCQLSRIPALLSTIAKILGHIRGDQYGDLCAAAGVNPDQTAINRIGAAPFLRENPKT